MPLSFHDKPVSIILYRWHVHSEAGYVSFEPDFLKVTQSSSLLHTLTFSLELEA